MFGTIRKHQTWLWFIIIGVMVISMLTFTSMNKASNGQRSAGAYGEMDGRLITESEHTTGEIEASLMYFLRTYDWPDNGTPRSGWNQEQETDKRIFLIRKLDQYDIHTDSQAVAQLATLILRGLENHYRQSMTLSEFVDRVLKPRNITADDFARFLEHDLSLQQLISVVGASGKLVPPAEVKALYIQEHQDIKAQVVFFSASNYLAGIPEPTPALLSQFYTNEAAEYRQPDEMQLSYVRFNITNYLPQAEKQLGTNISDQVQAAFQTLGTNALSLGDTEQEQKAKIQEILIRQTALSNAYSAALSFQKDLMAKEPMHPENLTVLAKDKGLEVHVTKPFDKEYGPSDLNLPSGYPISALFELTPDDPFTYTPVRGIDGIYILAYNKFMPSRLPPLEEIRSRVIADCKYVQAVRTAQVTGRVFSQSVTNGLAHGQTFAAMCAEARVTPADLPAFSESTENLPQVEEHMDPTTFKQVALTTPVGKASLFIPTRTGGAIVYVRQRLPIDEATMKADLPEFSNSIRQERENEAFNLWFNKEAYPALRDLPAFQKQETTS